MTVASHTETTFNSKTVHVIKADLDCVSVESISGSVTGSAKFGVNGTFFSGTSLLGIAINNGAAVRTGGTQTGQACGVSTKRGTMYCYSPSYNSQYLNTEVVKNSTDTGASASQIKWAIGGYSLFPYRSYSSSTDYYKDINGTGTASDCTLAKVDSENAYRLEPSNSRPRTAIGWNGSKIVLAAFASENAYNVRQFMINQGCSALAIMLDGGSSTQMRFGIPTPGGLGTGTFDPSGAGASVYQMVSVNPTSWI